MYVYIYICFHLCLPWQQSPFSSQKTAEGEQERERERERERGKKGPRNSSVSRLLFIHLFTHSLVYLFISPPSLESVLYHSRHFSALFRKGAAWAFGRPASRKEDDVNKHFISFHFFSFRFVLFALSIRLVPFFILGRFPLVYSIHFIRLVCLFVCLSIGLLACRPLQETITTAKLKETPSVCIFFLSLSLSQRHLPLFPFLKSARVRLFIHRPELYASISDSAQAKRDAHWLVPHSFIVAWVKKEREKESIGADRQGPKERERERERERASAGTRVILQTVYST